MNPGWRHTSKYPIESEQRGKDSVWPTEALLLHNPLKFGNKNVLLDRVGWDKGKRWPLWDVAWWDDAMGTIYCESIKWMWWRGKNLPQSQSCNLARMNHPPNIKQLNFPPTKKQDCKCCTRVPYCSEPGPHTRSRGPCIARDVHCVQLPESTTVVGCNPRSLTSWKHIQHTRLSSTGSQSVHFICTQEGPTVAVRLCYSWLGAIDMGCPHLDGYQVSWSWWVPQGLLWQVGGFWGQ